MTSKKELYLNKMAEYRDYLKGHPKLRNLFFELTDSCNLNCRHCGSSCVSSNSTFLDLGLIKKTLDEVAASYDTKDIWVCLTGGEPFLHPDLIEIIRYSKALGFRCGITSNGTLITKELANRIAEAGLDTITISVDGLDESHDWFRNQKGAFRKTIKGIENLRYAGLQAEAISVIHKKNIAELDDMFDFFYTNKFYAWRVVNMEPIGRAQLNDELLLDADGMKRMLDFIKSKRQKNLDMKISFACSHLLPLEYESEVRDWYFICMAGISVASVMVNGDIASCLDIERCPEFVQGNVKKNNFVDVWEHKFQIFRRDRTSESKVCSSCKDKKICGGDSMHTWNFDLNKPNYCIKNMLKSFQ